MEISISYSFLLKMTLTGVLLSKFVPQGKQKVNFAGRKPENLIFFYHDGCHGCCNALRFWKRSSNSTCSIGLNNTKKNDLAQDYSGKGALSLNCGELSCSLRNKQISNTLSLY